MRMLNKFVTFLKWVVDQSVGDWQSNGSRSRGYRAREVDITFVQEWDFDLCFLASVWITQLIGFPSDFCELDGSPGFGCT